MQEENDLPNPEKDYFSAEKFHCESQLTLLSHLDVSPRKRTKSAMSKTAGQAIVLSTPLVLLSLCTSVL